MKIDIASETWAAIKKRCEERIAACTEIIITGEHPDSTYAAARGEIAAYRDILALGDVRTIKPSGDYTKRSDRSGI